MRLRLVPVSAAFAQELEEYRAAFPADRARVTLEPERIPGLDQLEGIGSVRAWLRHCADMAGKISWYMLLPEGSCRILGCICLRHDLQYDDDEGDFASHIGYSVRPGERRKGYAKAMLRLALEKAREAGLTRVRVICCADNTASRRTIEGCGGVYLDTLTGEESGLTVRRYDMLPG